MNKTNIDLNLLTLFRLLMETRKVTAAAEMAGVTQSAMSHSLNRLRSQFDDPLFIKSSEGIIPTYKAEQLYQHVVHPHENLMNAIHQDLTFNPFDSERTFTFLMPDYVEQRLIPLLINHLSKVAPNIAIQCMLGSNDELTSTNANVDMIFGHMAKPPKHFYQRVLWQESFVTIVRSSHPRIKTRLSLKQFVREQHILISPSGSGLSNVDKLLSERRLVRKVKLFTPNFTTPPKLVSESELICTLPKSIADAAMNRFEIKQFKTPLALSTFDVSMVWNPVVHHDPAHLWLRSELFKLTSL